jgi:hypothetical protein
MGVGLLRLQLLMMTRNHGAPSLKVGRFFIYIYVGRIWLGPRLAREARPAHRSVSPVRTALGPCPHLSSLAQFISLFSFHVSGWWLGGSLTGRPPNGQVQTGRPLRCKRRRRYHAGRSAAGR